MKNFQFTCEGKEYWYSRSIVCTNYIYCKYKGEWYVLMCQRGPKVTLCELWNVPGGFLDHNETLLQCVIRETQEKTGLYIPSTLNSPKLYDIQDDPQNTGVLQHVIFSYFTNLGKVDNFPRVHTNYAAPGEVTRAEWVSIKESYKYDEVGGQFKNIMRIYKNKINPSLKNKLKNLF